MPNGEDVRLKVDHVKSKKVEGTLYMMSERMGWMPKHKDVFTLSFDYCDIKCKLLFWFEIFFDKIYIYQDHRISSDQKSKIRLQIVCYNEMMTTFHFCNPIGLDAQKKDRDAVSDLLKILLPEFKTMMDQALEVKTKWEDLIIRVSCQCDRIKVTNIKISVVPRWMNPILNPMGIQVVDPRIDLTANPIFLLEYELTF